MKVFALQFVLSLALILTALPLSARADGVSNMLSIFGAAQNSIDPFESAKNKVKLSGRQAMLAQRIGKSMCLVYLGHNEDHNLLQAAQASALFSETLDALRSGSVQKSVIKEDNPEILNELGEIYELWRPFKNSVNSILTRRSLTKEDLLELQAASIVLDERATRAADETERVYGGEDLGPAEASTLRMAGRQRQLIERATKEFCLSFAGLNVSENRQRLDETRTVFFDSVFNLTFGNEPKNILPAPSYELDLLFQGQFAAWFLLEAMFDQTLTSSTSDTEMFNLIERVTDNLVETSDEALELY